MDVTSGSLTLNSSHVLFPGRVHAVPSDTPPRLADSPPPPRAPPFSPPYPPPSAPPSPPPPAPLDVVAITLSSVGGPLLFLLLLLAWLAHNKHLRRVAEAVNAATEEARIRDAIEATRSLHHPCAMISAAHFFALGFLDSYERCRDAGKLTYRDTLAMLADAAQAERFYVFISQYVESAGLDLSGSCLVSLLVS